MKKLLLLGSLLLTSPGWAQTFSSFNPARNATAASRATVVSATLGGTLPATASLKVFSAQAGGRKAGTTVVNNNTIIFAPAMNFRAGETVAATVLANPGSRGQVWQFTTATTGSTGQFTQASSIDTAPGQTSGSSSTVTLADLDGDGDLDALVPGSFGQLLAWFPNDGHGHLTNANRSISTGTTVSNVAVGDIDADGDLDVVAASSRPSQFEIARNNSTGIFTTTTLPTTPLTTAVSSLLLFDADGDADLDLVYYNGNSQAPRQIEVRLNDGSGIFGVALASALPAQYGAATLQPADLDRDGDLDLVFCSNATINGTNGFVQPLHNNGQGSFASGTVYSAANYSGGAAVGDVNGDGSSDLAVVDFASASPVKILLNNGLSQFTAGAPLVSGGAAQLAAFVDADGDGDLDLLVHGNGNYLHLNDGQGNFGSATTISTSGAPYALAVADMDNDGTLDLVTIDAAPSAPLQVRLNSPRTATATYATTASAFRCWPNPVPAASGLYLEVPAATAATATLRDMLGRVVQQQAWAGAATSLPTANLRAGVYLLTVAVAGQLPFTRRVAVE